MSCFKFKEVDFNIIFFEKYNVKLLVIIGGDDIVFMVNWLIKFLKSKGLEIVNIYVFKIIDNDLLFFGWNLIFGFYFVKDEGVKIGNIMYEDVRIM